MQARWALYPCCIVIGPRPSHNKPWHEPEQPISGSYLSVISCKDGLWFQVSQKSHRYFWDTWRYQVFFKYVPEDTEKDPREMAAASVLIPATKFVQLPRLVEILLGPSLDAASRLRLSRLIPATSTPANSLYASVIQRTYCIKMETHVKDRGADRGSKDFAVVWQKFSHMHGTFLHRLCAHLQWNVSRRCVKRKPWTVAKKH